MRVAPCLVAAILLASCGSDASGTFETDEGERGSYSIDEQSGETVARITTEDGMAEMRSGENVPVNLPAGFTLFPEANVVSNTTFSQADAKGSLIILTSAAEPEVLAEYYRKQAEAAGVKIELELTVDDGKMIGGQSEDGHTFSFNANREGDETTAQLMVGEKLGR